MSLVGWHNRENNTGVVGQVLVNVVGLRDVIPQCGVVWLQAAGIHSFDGGCVVHYKHLTRSVLQTDDLCLHACVL